MNGDIIRLGIALVLVLCLSIYIICKYINKDVIANVSAKPIKFVLAIGVIGLAVVVIIDMLYLIGFNTGFKYTTNFTASNILSFYGDFLVFLGTISLGALALWQNDKLNKRNEKLEKDKEDRNLAIFEPELIFTIEDSQEKNTKILSIKNSGTSDVHNLLFLVGQFKDGNLFSKNQHTTTVAPGECSKVLLEGYEHIDDTKSILIIISCLDIKKRLFYYEIIIERNSVNKQSKYDGRTYDRFK